MLVAISNLCNLHCSYCFAKDMNIKDITYMSCEDYQRVMEWMVSNNDTVLKILGGEPTLHPEFEKILRITNIYARRYNWDISVLTNGTNLIPFLDKLPRGTKVLFNINHPNNPIEEKLFEKTVASIEACRPLGSFRIDQPGFLNIGFGCNLYPERTDYSYFWEIVDEYKCKNIRTSVTSPSSEVYLKDRDLYFKTMKPIFIGFMEEAAKRDTKVLLDCSYIPPCYFSPEEVELINSFSLNGDSYATCLLFGQVLPNMTYSICFGNQDYDDKVDTFDNYKMNIYSDDEKKDIISKHYMAKCEGCILKKYGKCQAGCFGFFDD